MDSINPTNPTQGSVQITVSPPSNAQAPQKSSSKSPVTSETPIDEFKKSAESKPSSTATEDAKSSSETKKGDSMGKKDPKNISELKMGVLGAGFGAITGVITLALGGATLGLAALPGAAALGGLSLATLSGFADGSLLAWAYNKLQKNK